jgi:hypothetical protein
MERNGLELYLLHRLTVLGIESVLPADLLLRLNKYRVNNEHRIAQMLAEMKRIDKRLTDRELTYCFVKGASLVSEACPDPYLRRQHNLDLMMPRNQSKQCSEILQSLGYVPYRITQHTWECERTVVKRRSTASGPTKEKHFLRIYYVSHDAPGMERSPYEALSRRQRKSVRGTSFAALAPSDHLIIMAIQIYGVASTGALRLSWLLEFATNVRNCYGDQSFWEQMQIRAEEHSLKPVAVAFAMRMASIVFKASPPESISKWLASNLNSTDDRWLSEYSHEIVCAGPIGTKLHRLRRKDAPSFQDDPEARSWKLSPLHPIVVPVQVAFREFLKLWISRLRRVFPLIHFHVIEELRYRRESVRWKVIQNELDSNVAACSHDFNW